MKRQLLRFTRCGKCHEGNTIMKTDHSASREKRLPSELFTHDLTLAHMRQTRKKSHLARSIALLVRCAFIALMGVAVLGVGDIAHAQQVLVSNFDQRSDFYLLPEGHNWFD